MNGMERAGEALASARRVVALTGAGISTDSGIPDFRGPNGIWTKDPNAERLSSLHSYMGDPEVRRRAWRLRLDHPAWQAEPNAAHHALVDLERRGKLSLLVTQNIDGLHQKAGTSNEVLVEIHGTLRQVVCMACGERGPMTQALDRVRRGEDDPGCLRCGGILKSATISFGQSLDHRLLARAYEAAASCDLFLAIGTSLTVFPVAHLPRIAVEAGAGLVIVNAQPTPVDAQAASVIRGPLGEVLPAVVAASSSW